ncbi:nucleoside-diphosphate-sugar epimerase [Massilia sp. UYP11]|uniref:NAD-dependent epimerase/dehydratase family protein n=1 Tax=Massilia sp. UYP11 TaxID=1756385 RepID=UPI003D1FB621
MPDRSSFARPRLLIVGCGDVGTRLLPLLAAKYRVFALTSQPERRAELRALGAVPVVADLDRPATLKRLRRLAPWVLHLAPPQPDGEHDRRTRHLAAALGKVERMVYVSTSGVYGDCGGALVHEHRPVAPRNARARRRVDAERILRAWAVATGASLSILRVPGIYADDRLPLRRLEQGTPALRREDDVYTSHVHADDLARIVLASLQRGRPGRVVHAVDRTRMKMADYFDAVADAFGMNRPPRLARTELQGAVSPMLLSFMSESRQLDDTRLSRELRVRLRHPDVATTLARLRRTS